MLRHVDEFALNVYSWLGSLRSEGGQTLVEYGLIASIIAVAILIAALLLFQSELANLFDTVAACMNGTCP